MTKRVPKGVPNLEEIGIKKRFKKGCPLKLRHMGCKGQKGTVETRGSNPREGGRGKGKPLPLEM